jgi:hypothetical protein
MAEFLYNKALQRIAFSGRLLRVASHFSAKAAH